METENGGYHMSSVKRVYVEKKPEYAVNRIMMKHGG